MNSETKRLILAEHADGKVLNLSINGRLDKTDYETLAPEIERLIKEHGKIRVAVELNDFHGWSAGGLWEDIKFDLKHFADIERVAIIGDKTWEHGMAIFCKPFTKAHVRFFPTEQRDEAMSWVAEDLAS